MLPQLKRLLPFAALLFFCLPAHATTRTAATCNEPDVATQVALSANGDTVNIPAGNCSWTAPLSVTVNIALNGFNSCSHANFSTCTASGTNITNNINVLCSGSPCPTTSNTINWTLNAGSGTPSISNISFLPSITAPSPANSEWGVYLLVTGTGQPMVMHDNAFNIPNQYIFQAVQWMVQGGVWYNNYGYSTNDLAGICNPPTVVVGSTSGSFLVKPQGNWDVASTEGTLDTGGATNLYIENNWFEYIAQIPDTDDNGRVVIRYNTFKDIAGGLTHGTTSPTGGRQVEIYGNQYLRTLPNYNISRWFWSRGGTQLITDNVVASPNLGSCYPNKSSFVFTVENAQGIGGHSCALSYMGFHQSGSGGSYPTTNSPTNVGSVNNSAIYPTTDVYQIPAPDYIWGNTGSGAGLGLDALNDGTTGGACNNTNSATGQLFTTSDFFVLNRDWNVDNGVTPTWTPYTYPHPLAATAGEVGMAAPPEISPTGSYSIPNGGGGLAVNLYPGTVTVTLSSPLTGGSFHICYTTNGTTPTAATAGTCDTSATEFLYSTPFNVTSTATVNAITTEVGLTNSYVANNLYTINGTAQLATPTLSPTPGNYASGLFPISVTIGCASGATCYYTKDGSLPTASSTQYTGAFNIVETQNVNVIAIKSGSTNSLLASGLYAIGTGGTPTAGTPTFSPVAGTYSATQTVTITSSPSTVICYNTTGSPVTNGTTGCTTGTLYTGPISVATTQTIFAVGGGTGYLDSTAGSAAYNIVIPAGASKIASGTRVASGSAMR